MRLTDSFGELEKLRVRIGAQARDDRFGAPMEPLEKALIQLEATGGIEVNPEDIQTVGPYLSYKGEVLSIVYIFNSSSSKSDLENNTATANTPKFHFTWCSTLNKMNSSGRFDRYISSRSKDNLFKVEAKEYVQNRKRYVVVDNVRLFPCKNCLRKIQYKGSWSNLDRFERERLVEEFTIREYLDENDGIFNVMKYTPRYTETNAPSGDYTEDFPRISTELRERANWHCSKCNIDMHQKKSGLHVHHINGVKSDNSCDNLQVLCALCHKNIDPFHKKMHIHRNVEQFIRKHRPSP